MDNMKSWQLSGIACDNYLINKRVEWVFFFWEDLPGKDDTTENATPLCLSLSHTILSKSGPKKDLLLKILTFLYY